MSVLNHPKQIFTAGRVLAGEYMVLNNYLVRDLMLSDQWSTEMKNKIIANDGSVQGITEIPSCFLERYKTVWEMSQKISLIWQLTGELLYVNHRV